MVSSSHFGALIQDSALSSIIIHIQYNWAYGIRVLHAVISMA